MAKTLDQKIVDKIRNELSFESEVYLSDHEVEVDNEVYIVDGTFISNLDTWWLFVDSMYYHTEDSEKVDIEHKPVY